MKSESSGFLLCASLRRLEAHWLARSAPGSLMERAAIALADQADLLLRELPPGSGVAAMVGPGDNGADALLALILLQQRGYAVRAYMLDPNQALPQAIERATVGDLSVAQQTYQRWRQSGGRTTTLAELPRTASAQGRPLVLLDGLFGIGLNRPLEAVAARVAQWTHRIDGPVIAVDIPSGLDADTGAVVGGPRAACVRASHTVTFIADKPGLHTGSGPDLAGRVRLDTLGVAQPAFDGICINQHWVRPRLPNRHKTAHKGSFGTVGIIGGSAGMPGAALLAAQGARAAGAGKVATVSPDNPVFNPGEPQLMAWHIERPSDIDRHLGAMSACAIGCGLGKAGAARNLLIRALSTDLPMVIDADALNVIALDQAAPGAGEPLANPAANIGQLLARRAALAPTVLTPHPLEAARLLSTTVQAVQANRITSAIALASRFGATVLLKGAGTVLAAPDGRWGIVASGGPALASGGTGDVLAGLTAGLLSQNHSAWEAAAVAAWIHGDAGDRWSLANPMARGLQSNQLIDYIVESFNHCDIPARSDSLNA